MQLVNGGTKGKSKLASMIKRMQDKDGDPTTDCKEDLNSETIAKEICKNAITEAKRLCDSFCFKTAPTLNTKDMSNSFSYGSTCMSVSDKFSTLVCPQPFQARPIKKTYSMQHPVSYLSVNLNNKNSNSSKEQPCVTNNVNLLKHTISFTGKQENTLKGKIIYLLRLVRGINI